MSDRRRPFCWLHVRCICWWKMVVWETLEDLGLSQETIEEEGIKLSQYGGLFPMSKSYSFVMFFGYVVVFAFIPGMVVKCFQNGDDDYALESAHLLLICINMFVQVAVFHYHSGITTKLYRAINDGFFSYGETMDEDSRRCIEKAAEKKKQRKKVLADMFRLITAACCVGIQVKRPLLYLYNGHGRKDVDGMDWLLYESPTGMYVPYSNYWLPYILGMILSYFVTLPVLATASATISFFLRFAEELLHQLYIIKLGLRNATRRANHLYNFRYGKDVCVNDDSRYDTCLLECLKSSVKHHILLTELFDDFKRMTYIPLFTVIFDGGALICLSTAIMITNESSAIRFSMYAFLIAEIYYSYIYCSYGDRLTTAFADIGDQLYLDDFLEHSKLMKPYLVMIHAHSLVPKKLSAAGFTSANLQSFGNVLRTAYSLMNFMLAQK